MKRLNKWSYILLTLVITWILQFMPILLKMDVTNTSVSSFDYSSVFFTIGGMMPTLIGLIFVFLTYSKAHKIDFLSVVLFRQREVSFVFWVRYYSFVWKLL